MECYIDLDILYFGVYWLLRGKSVLSIGWTFIPEESSDFVSCVHLSLGIAYFPNWNRPSVGSRHTGDRDRDE